MVSIFFDGIGPVFTGEEGDDKSNQEYTGKNKERIAVTAQGIHQHTHEEYCCCSENAADIKTESGGCTADIHREKGWDIHRQNTLADAKEKCEHQDLCIYERGKHSVGPE